MSIDNHGADPFQKRPSSGAYPLLSQLANIETPANTRATKITANLTPLQEEMLGKLIRLHAALIVQKEAIEDENIYTGKKVAQSQDRHREEVDALFEDVQVILNDFRERYTTSRNKPGYRPSKDSVKASKALESGGLFNMFENSLDAIDEAITFQDNRLQALLSGNQDATRIVYSNDSENEHDLPMHHDGLLDTSSVGDIEKSMEKAFGKYRDALNDIMDVKQYFNKDFRQNVEVEEAGRRSLVEVNPVKELQDWVGQKGEYQVRNK